MTSEQSAARRCFQRIYTELGNDVAVATSEMLKRSGRTLTDKHLSDCKDLGNKTALDVINIIISELGGNPPVYIPTLFGEIMAARNQEIINRKLKRATDEQLVNEYRLSLRQIKRILKRAE